MKKNIVVRILKIIAILILILLLVINGSIFIQTKRNPDSIPDIFGYKLFIVLSGSMESNINIGDLVIVKNVDVKTLNENDVIAFSDEKKSVTTHRIMETLEINGDTCFRTKGDANNTYDDGYVCSNNVEGKYKFKIAGLGNAILFIQEPLGFIVMMLIISIVCIIWYFLENRKIDKEFKFVSEEEKKEYEEFKKMKEAKKKKEVNDKK